MSRVSHAAVPLAVALTLLPLAVGCRTFTNPGQVSKVFDAESSEGYRVDRVSWDGTRRGTFIVKRGDRVFIVAEPPPDAVLEAATKLTADLKNELAKKKASTDATTTAKFEAEVTETVKVLARASEVSFLRDSLYRLAEAYANGAMETGDFAEHFDNIVFRASVLLASNSTNPALALAELARKKERLASKADAENDPAIKQSYELAGAVIDEEIRRSTREIDGLAPSADRGVLLAAVRTLIEANRDVLLDNDDAKHTGDWAAMWRWHHAVTALIAQLEVTGGSASVPTELLVKDLKDQLSTLMRGLPTDPKDLRMLTVHPNEGELNDPLRNDRLAATKKIRQIATVLARH